MKSTRRRVDHLFTRDELGAIEAAVETAERGTSAEIVPVVAVASARHHRGEDMAGVFLAFLAILALALFSPDHQIDGIEAVVAFIIAIAAGVFAAEKIPPLKRLFIARVDLEEAAADGALRSFRTYGVGETEGRTGVLIYVSLFERAVIVLGDRAAARALEPADYAAIRDVLIEGMRKGHTAGALVAAIGKAGEVLAAKLPRAPGDKPEISNRLRVLG